MQRGAVLDPTQSYRYSLWRVWNKTAPSVGFVMLNPSRADALVDDSTIRRCLGFAHSWNYGALEVVNLFAYRTANPKTLRSLPEPVGLENDRYLLSLGDRVDQIVLAWGNWGQLQGRDRAVLGMLAGRELYCLGMTQTQQPRHPLYLRRDVVPMLFPRDCAIAQSGIAPAWQSLSQV